MRRLPALSRVGALTALTAVLTGSVLTFGAAAAQADEVALRPAGGAFEVEGHGWGHGRGMSQWGAQGAASLGVDADTIVSTYYPGTSRAVLPDSPIRVLLAGDDGTDTQVHAAPGLSVTDLATGRVSSLPTGPTRWRIVPTGAGLRLDSLSGTTWTAGQASTGPLRLSGPTFVRVIFPNGTSRDYRGAVQAVRTSATRLQSVLVLGLEDYLLGVVPRESSASWRPAALQAQAIAARSYSAHKRSRVAGAGSYDICDTTMCQVFGGSALYPASGGRIDLEPTSTSQAVRATAGVVRTYGGAPILAEFSSSNGGWSTAGHVPYLTSRKDDWDGALPNPVHDWKATLPVADLESRFPAVGRLQRLRVTGRDGNGDWGGRVTSVVLEGTDSAGRSTSVTTTGAGVFGARSYPSRSDGLRSSWWRIASSAPPAPTLTAQYDGLPSSPGGTPPAGAPAVFADGRTVVVPRDGATTVRLTLRNTGDTAWPVGAASPVMLGTSAPRNRDSTAAGPEWAGPTRTARLLAAVDGSASVPPGRSGIFDVVLHGNDRPIGITAEAFEPLWSGTGWIEGALRTLNVVRTDPALGRVAGLHAAPAPTLGLDGEQVLVVRLRNYGGQAWPVGAERLMSVGAAPFALAQGWPGADAPPPLASNAVRPGAATVEPGEIGEWRVPVSSAGRGGGTYDLALQAISGNQRYGPVVRTRIAVEGVAGPRARPSARPLFKGSGPAVLGG